MDSQQIVTESIALDSATMLVGFFFPSVTKAGLGFGFATALIHASDAAAAAYDPARFGRWSASLGTIVCVPRAAVRPDDVAHARQDWRSRDWWVEGYVEQVVRRSAAKVLDLRVRTSDGVCTARCTEPVSHLLNQVVQGQALTLYGPFDPPSAATLPRMLVQSVLLGARNLDEALAARARRYLAVSLGPQIAYLRRDEQRDLEQALRQRPELLWSLRHYDAYRPVLEHTDPLLDLHAFLPADPEAQCLAHQNLLELLDRTLLDALDRCLSHRAAPPACAPWRDAVRRRRE